MAEKPIKFPSALARLGRDAQQKVLKEALKTPDPEDTIEWANTLTGNIQKWVEESDFFKPFKEEVEREKKEKKDKKGGD